MWQKLGTLVIRNRLALLITLGVITLIFTFFAIRVKLTYDFAKIIPVDDPDYIEYMKFKETFGEDGNVLAIGIKSTKLFEKDFFNDLVELNKKIEKVNGVEKAISIANIYMPYKDEAKHELNLKPVITGYVETQQEMDSIKNLILSMPIYKGLLYNKNGDVALLAITLNKQKLDSKERIPIVNEIEKYCNTLGEKHNITFHYSGLPYVRTIYASKVADEIKIFTYLSILITAIFIFIFFRFISAVIFSLVLVFMSVLITLGSIEMFGYKITLLTGLIPPLIVIIGVQNCIYMLTVYHQEYRAHGNKMLALTRLISRGGLPLFLTNTTTAIGFCVFSYSGSVVLDQFSIISGLNIMLVYVISLVFFPIAYSYLPPPKEKHTKHLDGKHLNKVMDICNNLVTNHRKAIYATIIAITIVSVWASLQIQTLGYVVDDLPQKDKVFTDLKFFEKELKGVLPYEIQIDTKRKNGVKDLSTLQKMNRLERELAEFPELSKALSIVDVLKFANQGYNEGNEKYYIIPSALEISGLLSYLPKNNNMSGGLMKGLVDSNMQVARMSIQMADVGSVDMKVLNNKVQKIIDDIFPKDKYDVKHTGTSLIFLKGNDYLITNLLESMTLALVIISLLMAVLFFSWRMVLISLIPNLIPLLMTLGIMGLFDIRLKPSTIIIFSMVYGIVVDYTILYLARYRHSLIKLNWDMKTAIKDSLEVAGPSIIYSAIALFAGFIIFAFSDFGGTIALGVLTSLALLFGMFTNLLLLPALLLSMEKAINNKKEFEHVLVDIEGDPTDSE